jgi:hypothetical protein
MIHAHAALESEAPGIEPRAALRLHRPRGGNFLLAVALMAVALGSGEILARTQMVQASLLAPSLGSAVRDFELRWFQLEQLAAHSGIQCVLIGNSMAQHGFDPEVFTETYRSRTGRNLHCFNFGIGGMTISTSAMIAEILVHRYHPAVLIYGASVADYGEWAYKSSRSAKGIELVPWVQYELGTFSFAGWLTAHSSAYRYYLTHRNWMSREYWKYVIQSRRAESSEWTYGVAYADRQRHMSAPTARPPDAKTQRLYSHVFAEDRVSDRSLRGLERLLKLREEGIRLVVVEMPLPKTVARMPRFRARYLTYVDTVARTVRAHDVLYWGNSQLNLIPDDGWRDYSHMNGTGARAFSTWLGEQMGALDSPPLSAPAAEPAT